MSSAQDSTPKSPLLVAIGISCAIALGSLIATLDYAQVEDVATGQFLVRPLTEAQQRNAGAISALEHTVGAISKDIDFVTERVSTSMRRNESQTVERLASLEAEIATLKDKLAGIQHARAAAPVRTPEPLFTAASTPTDMFDMGSLRSSLNDLSTAHNSAIAAITKRLDKIETQIGGSTDTPPVASSAPPRRKVAAPRKIAPAAFPVAQPAANTARPDRGYLFNVKPVSHRNAPLRVSRLRD
jgi:hypothetical protein